MNWDYVKNAEYDDSAHDDVGLTKVEPISETGATRPRNAIGYDAVTLGNPGFDDELPLPA